MELSARTLRTIECIVCSVGMFFGIQSISMKNYTKGLQQFTAIGLIPLSIIAGLRHIFTPGSIISGQSNFFEFEVGGANLAVGIAAILALLMKMDNKTLGIIYVIYALYFINACIAWILFIGNSTKKYIMLTLFGGLSAFLLYFAHIAFTKKEDE